MPEIEEAQPIIIRKKRSGHKGHHGGAWKVAFADFMTAMMAFFLVMWLVAQKPEVRESVAGFFREPGRFMKEGSAGLLKGSQSIIPMKEETIGIRKDDPDRQGFGPSEQEKKLMRKAARDILHELERQEIFQALKENIKIQLTSEGLRIILNECEGSPAFFEPGSAKLLKKSAIILMTIAVELGELQNRLVVEGHTDAAYMGGGAYSNWELSADRANAARQLMEVSGLREDQVREVRGFADQYPMVLNDPADHRNRRVTIVVLYRSRDAQYDELEVGADLMAEIED